MTTLLKPAVTAPAQLIATLQAQGHAALSPQGLHDVAQLASGELDALRAAWDQLPPDAYLRDGGRYRRRRHSCFVVDAAGAALVPHRAHWQPVEYNALHGGLQRWFEPVDAVTLASPAWSKLLVSLAGVCSSLKGVQPWFVEAHQFRIDTTDGIGRPTPEGAHRDGVDFVTVLLVARVGVKGGETRVFDATGPNGLRFTMTEAWTTLLLDDERVVHESTPIQPLATAGAAAGPAHRDTLVLTFRRGGFQGQD